MVFLLCVARRLGTFSFLYYFQNLMNKNVKECFRNIEERLNGLSDDIIADNGRILGDRIKGLKLRHFGKQNFTYYGKLRRPSRQAAVDEG